MPNTASLQPLRSGGDCSDFTLDFSHISPRILLYFLKDNCLISNRVISSCVLNTSYMESPGSISLVHVLLMHDITVLSVARFESHTVSFSLFLQVQILFTAYLVWHGELEEVQSVGVPLHDDLL